MIGLFGCVAYMKCVNRYCLEYNKLEVILRVYSLRGACRNSLANYRSCCSVGVRYEKIDERRRFCVFSEGASALDLSSSFWNISTSLWCLHLHGGIDWWLNEILRGKWSRFWEAQPPILSTSEIGVPCFGSHRSEGIKHIKHCSIWLQ